MPSLPMLATAERGLVPVDYAVIALYVVVVVGLGFYFARRQSSRAEYFIGSGAMNPTLIGISLFATLLSTITYLAMPGEVIGKGPIILIGVLVFPINYLVVGHVLIPAYMRYRVTSAYELLEMRLGVGGRLLGAVMFIALRVVWMSLLIFLSAKALTVMMGIDESWVPAIVLIAGFVSVLYTSVGGLRTVIVTDLIQAILLLGGALMVIGYVTYAYGGFGWFPTTWHPQWDHQPVFSTDLSTRVTISGTLLAALVWGIATAGGDQTAIQRYMATRDAKAARQAYMANLAVAATVMVVLALVGFALLGYFQEQPQAMPEGLDVAHRADDLFPHYIAYHLPPIISGLIVAAMFAAAMSSVDSGVNAITAVVMSDFVDRFRSKPLSQRVYMLIAKLLAFGIGGVVVVSSTMVGQVPGNILAVTQKTSNLLVTPLFALFIFALFVPFVRPAGAIIGVVTGGLAAGLVSFSGPIFGYVDAETQLDPISFQWVGPTGLIVSLVVGIAASSLLSLRNRKGG